MCLVDTQRPLNSPNPHITLVIQTQLTLIIKQIQSICSIPKSCARSPTSMARSGAISTIRACRSRPAFIFARCRCWSKWRGKLREFAARRKELIDAFLTAYPALCQEAAKRLRSLYNPADYPPLEYVAQQFTLIWQYISFGVPDQLREISTKIWHDEREKAAEMMAEAGREI